jgi:2-oxoglutarate ferredoxin oxidoreductase subunit delta
MAGKARINAERCKGCGLCVEICPNKVLAISQNSNKMGYFFAEPCGQGCTGCAMCALVCPDVAIEVYRLTTEEAAK